MFKEREPFFSLSNNQFGNFETFNYGKNSINNTNYNNNNNSHNGEDGGGISCSQMKRQQNVPMSLPSSSLSGDEEMSISPSSSFCGGFAINSTSRSDSDFNVGSLPGRNSGGGSGGQIDRLTSMSSPCGGVGGGSNPQGVRCYGCGHPIVARYYVSAMNSTWHNECLKCHICQVILSEEPTCFEKAGQILCKQDYLR
jgi:hypothetical protein